MLAIAAALALAQVAPLTPAEKAAGWRLYSGADARELWRAYKGTDFPSRGWKVEDGVMSINDAGGAGGDIVTRGTFEDVEARFEFRLGPGANSGIMWGVTETHDATWQSGPEYQLIDDAGAGVEPHDLHSCGALYDLAVPAEGKRLNPAGKWNSGRIYVRGGIAQHWLNGVKIVEVAVGDADGAPTADWKARIAGSKFKDYAGFGVAPRGRVAIQDHGDTALSLRRVLIRDPGAPMEGEVSLFNGKDLTGWKAVVPEAADKGTRPEDVWSVADGVLRCAGTPVGYIRTEADYTNYVLRVRWRFDPAKGAGNSGVLLRMVGEDKVWPRSVEAQLESGNAGDFWNIDEFKMETEASRRSGRHTSKTHGAERPLGEWNDYEIVVDHGTITLLVNGEELNRATGVEELAGKICLQSEGAPIEFKEVRLAPIP